MATHKTTKHKKIHVACKQLGLDSGMRHDLQLMATGKASMTDMTEADMDKVLAALKERGFSARQSRRKPASRADVRYCHVLWRLLHEADVARTGGAKGLNAFIRAQFENTWGHVPIDIDAMTEFSEINDVIEALKAWCRREGIPTETGRRG
ncbi:MAG: regulatory protein GemA [Pseudoruegeria sp.]